MKEAVGSIGLTKRTSGCFNHEIQVGVLSLSANEGVLSAEPERTLDLTAGIETGFMRESRFSRRNTGVTSLRGIVPVA